MHLRTIQCTFACHYIANAFAFAFAFAITFADAFPFAFAFHDIFRIQRLHSGRTRTIQSSNTFVFLVRICFPLNISRSTTA